MKIRPVSALAGSLLVLLLMALPAIPQKASEGYLSWNSRKVKIVSDSMYGKGRVGRWGIFCYHCRLLKTDQSTGYKLRAMWFTPEVIRASARQEQLKRRLPDDKVRKMVQEAEAVGDTVIMVEIDPDEGSGVIPLDWDAFFGPKRGKELDENYFVYGVNKRKLRKLKALTSVRRRNYDYDRFWVIFPLLMEDGTPLFSAEDSEAALVVSIYGREGIVRWKIPASIRKRAEALSRNSVARQDTSQE